MNILLVPKNGARSRPIYLSPLLIIAGVFSAVSLMAVFIGAGVMLGQVSSIQGPAALVEVWHSGMEKQRQEIAEASENASQSLDGLALKLGRMQSHIVRINALGSRLTELAGMENGEFDFSQEPAQGGPFSDVKASSVNFPDFIASLNSLEEQVESRLQQLGLLETMLMDRNVLNDVLPSGRPIKSGWLSSYFGMRTDPFTGHQEHHKGIDFAGKLGGDVISVGAGVVTWAGKRYGYGNLVEINHGNGYSTRYGHNQKILVVIGETVKRGQALALIGSTGRSTGPHVHFEVMRNGRQIDPMNYIKLTKTSKPIKF